MDEAQQRQLTAAAANFRAKAEHDRVEADRKGAAWWGYHLLIESAEYYEKRASDIHTQLRPDWDES